MRVQPPIRVLWGLKVEGAPHMLACWTHTQALRGRCDMWHGLYEQCLHACICKHARLWLQPLCAIHQQQRVVGSDQCAILCVYICVCVCVEGTHSQHSHITIVHEFGGVMDNEQEPSRHFLQTHARAPTRPPACLPACPCLSTLPLCCCL